jgi:hypothetical protein
MTNATTMLWGRYDASHIARWSGLVASCKASKCRHQASARAVSARWTSWLSLTSSNENTCNNFLLATSVDPIFDLSVINVIGVI